MLVWHDLLGLYDGQSPRFVKRYADLAAEIERALDAYAADVRERRFPEEQHTYAMPDEELAAFEEALLDRASVARRRPRARAATRPSAASARPQLQPWTVLHADGEQDERPRGEGERRAR